MDSKKLPLWLVFENADVGAPPVYVIFKVGDDLRQDILTLQMISLMYEQIKMVPMEVDLLMKPYAVVATGDDIGMLEVVMNAACQSTPVCQLGFEQPGGRSCVSSRWLGQAII